MAFGRGLALGIAVVAIGFLMSLGVYTTPHPNLSTPFPKPDPMPPSA